MAADKSTQKKSAVENESDSGLQTLKIKTETDRLLTVHSKKLKLSKREYANAAIAYFAETGLNPVKERPHGLADVTMRMGQETKAVRDLNLEIGNRVISILRGWEKTLYGFLIQQQQGTLNYIEQIENNILGHQVQVESSYLAPMIEQLFKVNLEANTTRNIAARVYVEVTQKEEMAKKSPERFQDQKAVLDKERAEQLIAQAREFIRTNSVAKPRLSPKPQTPAVPAKAPSVPAGTTPK